MESIIQNAAGIFLTIWSVIQFLALGYKLSNSPMMKYKHMERGPDSTEICQL